MLIAGLSRLSRMRIDGTLDTVRLNPSIGGISGVAEWYSFSLQRNLGTHTFMEPRITS